MATIEAKNNPAKTYTWEQFIAMHDQDDLTYANFGIIRYRFGTTLVEESILDYYFEELKSICNKVEKIYFEDAVKYKYSPDLLSYDLYGTTQLDFIILLCNGIIDPKEFDMKQNWIYAPKRSELKAFLSRVYNAEDNWLKINKSELKQDLIKALNEGV